MAMAIDWIRFCCRIRKSEKKVRLVCRLFIPSNVLHVRHLIQGISNRQASLVCSPFFAKNFRFTPGFSRIIGWSSAKTAGGTKIQNLSKIRLSVQVIQWSDQSISSWNIVQQEESQKEGIRKRCLEMKQTDKRLGMSSVDVQRRFLIRISTVFAALNRHHDTSSSRTSSCPFVIQDDCCSVCGKSLELFSVSSHFPSSFRTTFHTFVFSPPVEF